MNFKTSIDRIIIYGSVITGYFFWYKIRIAQIMFAMIFGLCILVFLNRNATISKRIYPYVLLMLFMTAIAAKNEDIIRVAELPGLLVIAVFIYTAKVPPNEIKRGIIRLLKISSILFALPLSSNQAQWWPSYCGIFSNPDTLGGLESLAFCIIFVQVCEYYLNDKRIPKSNLVVMALNVICCLISQSRMSMLGIAVTVIGVTIYASIYMRRNEVERAARKIRKLRKISLIIMAGCMLAILFLLLSGKLPVLITKMTNISTVVSRFDLYKDHLSTVNMFGTNRKNVTVGTDSTIIYLAVWFGPIVSGVFYLFLTISFLHLLKIQIKGMLGFDGFYAIVSMGIFFLQSITTDMLYTAAMFLAIIFCGMVMSKKNYMNQSRLISFDQCESAAFSCDLCKR